MALAHFRIVLEPGQEPVVELNGEVYASKAISLVVIPGQDVARLRVEVPVGAGTIEGDGIVETSHEDAAEDLSALLGKLDGQELERQVLDLVAEEPGLGTGEAFLKVLRNALEPSS